MAISKKTKKVVLWIVGGLFAVFVLPRLVSDFKLRGPWNGKSLTEVKSEYPGIRVGILGNVVTVSSRKDLRGTLVGNTITWNNGGAWTRG